MINVISYLYQLGVKNINSIKEKRLTITGRKQVGVGRLSRV
jgi:hypothetical protein